MNDKLKRLLAINGISESDASPNDESVTITDLLEYVELLTELVLGGDEE